MVVRILEENEIAEALDLVWEVFSEYEAPEYGEEGVLSFRQTLYSEDFKNIIVLYGAFEGDKLAGVAATRNRGTHIALFFVLPQYHRRGIGRAMFETIVSDSPSDTITVNSSPYAAKIYERLGFEAVSQEQTVHGIRFIPMEYKKGAEADRQRQEKSR